MRRPLLWSFPLFSISDRRIKFLFSTFFDLMLSLSLLLLFHVYVYHLSDSTSVLVFLSFVSTYIFHVLITTSFSLVSPRVLNHLSPSSLIPPLVFATPAFPPMSTHHPNLSLKLDISISSVSYSYLIYSGSRSKTHFQRQDIFRGQGFSRDHNFKQTIHQFVIFSYFLIYFTCLEM